MPRGKCSAGGFEVQDASLYVPVLILVIDLNIVVFVAAIMETRMKRATTASATIQQPERGASVSRFHLPLQCLYAVHFVSASLHA